VWEWTSDYYGREPPQVANRFDPRGPAFAAERTVRGGSYRSPPSDLRITRRLGVPAFDRRAGLGFRCAYDRNTAETPPP
jgi:formylglycine-generating enzyme required for sulfatase activity